MVIRRFLVVYFILSLSMGVKTTYGAEYTLAIQPILPPDKLEKSYAPLIDYLSKETGETIRLHTFRSFKSYWYSMKRGKGFDMVLDGAHFTDYRIDKSQYRVLAKQPDTVSFSLVTRGDLFVFDADELVSHSVASMSAPSMGGLRLKQMFLGVDEHPTVVGCYSSEDCVKQIRNGRADAAIIPTPLVKNYDSLNVVMTTDPLPHTAFSVSPDVPDEVANAIQSALVDASKNEEGRKMLAAVKLPSFVPASNELYEGYADLLKIMKQR